MGPFHTLSCVNTFLEQHVPKGFIGHAFWVGGTVYCQSQQHWPIIGICELTCEEGVKQQFPAECVITATVKKL